jgi:hypothetical protein
MKAQRKINEIARQTNVTLENEIKNILVGIYKIEIAADGTHVYTENCFCDSKTIIDWLNRFQSYGIVNIDISYRYDRTHGLVYVFQTEEQMSKR